MKLLDILTAPWAIEPAKLQEIRDIYITHMKGEKIDIKGLEAKLGEPLNNEPQGYKTRNGVALLPVDGIIAKRMNMFSKISGGTSTELIERDLKEALADDEVTSIVLSIDSPGGSVDGIFELAKVIFDSRGTKPIIAHTDGSMSSAAYLIGAATEKVYISGGMTRVGSIGVVAAHIDVSGMESKAGVKTTEISAGKHKRITSRFAPLSVEGATDIQEKVDYIYSVFVSDIAKFRGVTEEQVLEDMADGRTFLGKQAIEAGLVDGVSTLDALIDRLAGGDSADAPAGVRATTDRKENLMDLAELKEKHADLYHTVLDEGKAAGIEEGKKTGHEEGHKAGLVEGQDKGAQTEVERIKAVKAHTMPGHEALIEELMFDGKTTGDEAAGRVLAAEKAAMEAKAAAIVADAPDAVPPAEPGDDTVPAGATDEEKAKAEWDKKPELRDEFGGDFDSYMAFEKNKGSVKILRDKQ